MTATLTRSADVSGRIDQIREDHESLRRELVFKAANGDMSTDKQLMYAFGVDGLDEFRTLTERMGARYKADERRRAAQTAIDAARGAGDKFARHAAETAYCAACGVLVDSCDPEISSQIQEKRREFTAAEVEKAKLEKEVASVKRGRLLFDRWGDSSLCDWPDNRHIVYPFWHKFAGMVGGFHPLAREERVVIERDRIRPADKEAERQETQEIPAVEERMRQIEVEIAELHKTKFDPNQMDWKTESEVQND